MELKYLEDKFNEWFDMPLDFDPRVNEIIRQTALLSFKRGYLCPEPTIFDKIVYLFRGSNHQD